MKTMKAWLVLVLFMMCLGFTFAQQNTINGLSRPTNIDELLFAGEPDKAITEFENFKKEQLKTGTDSYDLDRLELFFYQDLSTRGGWMYPMSEEMKNSLGEKYIVLQQQFVKKFANRAQSYIIQCTNAKPEDVVKLTTKAISLEPENEEAYMLRAGAYRMLGKEDAAKADEEKAKTLRNQQ